MENRPFSEKELPPNDESLKEILGKVYKFYVELDTRTHQFKRDWNYSKGSGWIQKVHDRKKALYYLIPMNDAFIISLTLREQEKMKFVSDTDLREMRDLLENAKKYSEGYALRFAVVDRISFSEFIPLFEKLKETRK